MLVIVLLRVVLVHELRTHLLSLDVGNTNIIETKHNFLSYTNITINFNKMIIQEIVIQSQDINDA